MVEQHEQEMVGGYLPTSFLDWEGHVAPVIFTAGCNFCCPWCHNGELVFAQNGEESVTDILADIRRREQFLDGVVITGGEPTLWSGLLPLLRELKKIGLAVKLDTNGSNPRLLREILMEELVSHVAMDVKAPFDDKTLARVTGAPIAARLLLESLSIIRELAPSYELRTTWSPHILSEAELIQIRDCLADDPNWVVQPFVPANCLDPRYRDLKRVDPQDIKRILPDVRIRG